LQKKWSAGKNLLKYAKKAMWEPENIKKELSHYLTSLPEPGG
jgi:hypothetical protein